MFLMPNRHAAAKTLYVLSVLFSKTTASVKRCGAGIAARCTIASKFPRAHIFSRTMGKSIDRLPEIRQVRQDERTNPLCRRYPIDIEYLIPVRQQIFNARAPQLPASAGDSNLAHPFFLPDIPPEGKLI